MKTPHPFAAIFGVLIPTFLAIGIAPADQVIKTIPGGDGTEILANPKYPGEPLDAGHAGGTLVVDTECGEKTLKGQKLNTARPNPEYTKCVKDKLEKAKKKGEH